MKTICWWQHGYILVWILYNGMNSQRLFIGSEFMINTINTRTLNLIIVLILSGTVFLDLRHRWSTILESVNMFCGYYTQIQNRRQCGLTERNKVVQACEMYKSMDKNNESFSLLH
uniref:Uncharacterized protein n=1 Tax=Arundo donax TaxID=35708 RepID=A0A0A9DGZ8_ARUDO